jgi:hypothetical protein
LKKRYKVASKNIRCNNRYKFGDKMFEEIVNSSKITTLTLYGKYSIPAWTLIQYCKDTINNAIKITSIVNMCKLIERGKAVYNFAVENHSKDLYQIVDTDDDSYNKEYSYNNITESGRNTNTSYKFWYLIKKQERPNILVKENNRWFPIYESKYDTAFQIRKIIVESPPLISFEGLGETINALRYAADEEKRKEITWKNQQINQTAENIIKILNCEKIIHEYDIDDGFGLYAKEILNSVFEEQKLISDSIGIKTTRIDIKI